MSIVGIGVAGLLALGPLDREHRLSEVGVVIGVAAAGVGYMKSKQTLLRAKSLVAEIERLGQQLREEGLDQARN